MNARRTRQRPDQPGCREPVHVVRLDQRRERVAADLQPVDDPLGLLVFRDGDSQVDALLALASSEAGLSQHEPLDLAEVTKAALDVPRPGIDRLGLDVRSDLQPAVLRATLCCSTSWSRT